MGDRTARIFEAVREILSDDQYLEIECVSMVDTDAVSIEVVVWELSGQETLDYIEEKTDEILSLLPKGVEVVFKVVE